jgi:uncharacterized membrane protein
MSEPESLATDEALSEHIRRHAYDRLLMLSDGIFAIAITLAALEIQPPPEHASVAQMVQAMARPIIAYLVSFGMIGIFWIQHRDLFARVRRVDAPLTLLTLALLCLVALLPAVIHGLYSPGRDEAPFRLYALVMVACGFGNVVMWLYVTVRPGLIAPEVSSTYLWSRVIGTLGMPLILMPALFLTLEQTPAFVVPLGAALLLVRRVLLPRWVARRAQPAMDPSDG